MALAAPQPPFIYSPLASPRHIRLLEIQHDEDELTPLRCKLQDINIDDDHRVPYAALSYTWGQSDLSEPLILDNAIKLITPNLLGALRRFRQVGRLRWIWVDAVCINQDDDREKSVQIPFMGRIYHDASYVTVWLGDRSEDVESLKALRAAVGKGFANIEPNNESSELLSTHVTRITQHSWFTRRWIIQEMTLNPSVTFHCGNMEMSWQRLAMAIQKVGDSSPFRAASVSNAMSLWDIWIAWSMPHVVPKASKRQNLLFPSQVKADYINMHSLLHAFDHFNCSDPRDRIYAIVGLKQDTIPVNINYSLSVDQVFIDFSLAYANTEVKGANNLSWILAEASTRSQGRLSGGLPSWVPDWRIPSTGELPFTTTRAAGEGIGPSEDKTHHILTLNVFHHPLPLLRHENAPLRVAWKVCRLEDEDFPDFVTRTMVTFVSSPPRGAGKFSDEDNWNGIKFNMLSSIMPWTVAGIAFGDDKLRESVQNLPVKHLDQLQGLMRECWREMQIKVLDPDEREFLTPYVQLGLTVRSVFFGQEIHLPADGDLGAVLPGIGFSDINIGDRISVLSNQLKTSDRLRIPEIELPEAFAVTAGLILREAAGFEEGTSSENETATAAVRSQSHFNFVSCCYMFRGFRQAGWNGVLSEINLL